MDEAARYRRPGSTQFWLAKKTGNFPQRPSPKLPAWVRPATLRFG